MKLVRESQSLPGLIAGLAKRIGDFKKTGGVHACRITQKRAYEYFVFWAKQSGMKNPPKNANFEEDLAEVGIKRTRKTMTCGSKRYVYVFMRPYAKKKYKTVL